MRRNPTPAITPQMYRHFAAVTVVVTALMAFLANGENRKATAATSAEHRIVPRTAPSEQRLEPPSPMDSGTWGNDEGDGFGRPMIVLAAGGGAWAPGALELARKRVLTEDDDPADEKASETPTAAQIAAAAEASRQRGGARGND